jgi:hypothetical protein
MDVNIKVMKIGEMDSLRLNHFIYRTLTWSIMKTGNGFMSTKETSKTTSPGMKTWAWMSLMFCWET